MCLTGSDGGLEYRHHYGNFENNRRIENVEGHIRCRYDGSMYCVVCARCNAEEGDDQSAALEFKMKSLAGKEIDLSIYQGKVVLIVNVASECGLTPQYEQLQALHDKYADDGLAILGFPCNQFGKQEPGSVSEIQEFCRVNYGVTFKMFEKVKVNGDGACDLYQALDRS